MVLNYLDTDISIIARKEDCPLFLPFRIEKTKYEIISHNLLSHMIMCTYVSLSFYIKVSRITESFMSMYPLCVALLL